MKLYQWIWRVALLVVLHVVLFTLGGQWLGPPVGDSPPVATGQVWVALLAIGGVDVGLLAFLIRRSRLYGARLATFVAVFFYFTKTFTSVIEAAYFMKNVTPAMVPGLFLMTLPLCFALPLVAVPLLGRSRGDVTVDSWLPVQMGRGELALKIVVLSAVVYPFLFFVFGYFVAWTSPAVRAFYGGGAAQGFVPHLAASFAAAPLLYPLEAARGAMWVVAAWAVLGTTRGSWWQLTLFVGLAFALLQNDVHWLPNALMPVEVRTLHFVETASSNFLNALAIGWLLHRSHRAQPLPFLGA